MLATPKRPTSIATYPLRTKLLNAYGVPSNSDAKLLQAPLYFVRGGYVRNSGSLYLIDLYGEYWSRVSSSGSDAYALDFLSSRANPSDDYYRYSGYLLRCVAIGS